MLKFGSQIWKARRPGSLAFHLWHAPIHQGHLYFSLEMSFVPPWLDEDDFDSKHRTLQLRVVGSSCTLRDWRALAGLELATHDAVIVNGQLVTPDVHQPEVSLWSYGPPGGVHLHADAAEACVTRMVFGGPEGDGFEFPFEVEAFYPSHRAAATFFELGVRQMFHGNLAPADLKLRKRLREGRRLNCRGRLRFEQVLCAVPVNAADPIRWAKHLAHKKLNLSEFGLCRVNGACGWGGAANPKDGICEHGRCVVLTPAEAACLRVRASAKASRAG